MTSKGDIQELGELLAIALLLTVVMPICITTLVFGISQLLMAIF